MVVLSDAKLIMNGLPPKKDDILRLPISEPASEASARLLFLNKALRAETQNRSQEVTASR